MVCEMPLTSFFTYMQVPLNAVKEFLSLEQTREGLAEAERNGQLSQIRSYLEAVARIPYELSEASRGKLVDEFVQIRQCDTSFTAEDFQVRLTVSLFFQMARYYQGCRMCRKKLLEHTRSFPAF